LLDVWLFRDEMSYASNVSAIFGETPSTPYGFYSRCRCALIMNVSTGYGTLVHEMVHAYMDANFPDAPVWFNEGLASLFERPRERDGHLVGETNWRLPGLQRAIAGGVRKQVREVLEASRGDFDGKDAGLFYAEARYLCFYLQDRGLLVRFYRRFERDHARDPRGAATLEDVIGTKLEAFQPAWEDFVKDLSYRAGS